MNLFQTELVYSNGVRVSSKLIKQLELERISSEPESDRSFINAQFFIFFPEKLIMERTQKGLDRETILSEFRESDQYNIMKGIWKMSNWFINLSF